MAPSGRVPIQAKRTLKGKIGTKDLPSDLDLRKLARFNVIAFSLMSLLAEASRVIELRLRMIASGNATSEELLLMLTEKMEAMEHAGRIIVGGGSPALVVDNYRKIVAANVERLGAAREGR